MTPARVRSQVSFLSRHRPSISEKKPLKIGLNYGGQPEVPQDGCCEKRPQSKAVRHRKKEQGEGVPPGFTESRTNGSSKS